jgi:hypothetical protein
MAQVDHHLAFCESPGQQMMIATINGRRGIWGQGEACWVTNLAGKTSENWRRKEMGLKLTEM